MTTATSNLLRTIADFRSRLLAREAQAAAEMERYHQHTIAASINPMLANLFDQIQRLYDENPGMTTDGIPLEILFQYVSLQRIKDLISGKIDQFGALAQQQTRLLQLFGVNLGIDSAQNLLGMVVPPKIRGTFGVPSMRAIEGLVGATQNGSPLARLFRGFGAEAADRVEKALISGVTLGRNPRVIADSVQDALNVSKNRALTISRQESLRCYKNASLLTYRENDDVLSGWRWTSAKQKRTCVVCLAMDGKVFKLEDEFESHIMCRCTPIPISKTYDELLSQYDIDASDVPETSISAAKIQTGVEWFEKQPEKTKRQIIGTQSGYELYKSGQVSLDDFVRYHFDKEWGGSRTQTPVRDLVKK